MTIRLRGAVFGCGMIAEYHLKGWRRVPEVEIVALGDRDADRAEHRRSHFVPTARVYDTLPALVAGQALDFIDILTPPAAHADHCLLARDAGLHVICQKPLCDTLGGAARLVGAFADSPRLFAVHENHRYRPWFQDVLRSTHAGAFGRLRFVRLEHHSDIEPAEAYKLRSETGVWLEYGTHLVDMMRALLGEPRRVYGRTHAVSPAVRGESLAHAVYEYADATVVIDVAWKPAGLPQGSLLVEGDAGEAYYEGTLTRGEAARFRIVHGREVVAERTCSPTSDYEESFYLFERACADAMLGGPPIAQTAAESLLTLVCTFAAYEAARTGAVVDIPEFAARHGAAGSANRPT